MGSYAPLVLGMPGTGQPKCPDQYTPESTLVCPRSKRLMLQIGKQALVVQLGVMQQGIGMSVGSVQWQTEEPYFPIVASLGREFDAVRVRNFTPGQEAQAIVSVS
jgi:hypothetical protein